MNNFRILVILIFILIPKWTSCLNVHQKDLIRSLLNVEKAVVFVEVLDNCQYKDAAEKVLLSKELHMPMKFYMNHTSMNTTLTSPLINRKLFILDFIDCPSLQNHFETIDKFYLQHPFRWIIFTNELNILEKIPALLASNLIIALPRTSDNGYELKQVYKIKQYSRMQIEDYGYWTPTKGLIDKRITSILSRRRKNFKGELLIATTSLTSNESLRYLYNYRGKQWDTPLRVMITQMLYIIDLLNATNRFIFTPRFGYDETGIWVGTSGNLFNEHADLATNPLFVTAERLLLMDYLATVGPFKGYFIFRAPRLSSVANIYTLPFSRVVWICFGVTALILTLFIYIVLKSEDKFLKHSQTVALTDAILLSVSAICQMGSVLQANLISTRILTFFLFITFVFTYTSFTASIVALLQSFTKSIQTLEDLYKSEIQLGAEDTLYNRYYFGKTSDPVRLKIFNEKIAPVDETPHFYDTKTGVAKLRKGMYGFFAPATDIYKEIEETFQEYEKCGLKQLEYLEIVEPYHAVKKNSPLKEILKVNLLKIRENGITLAEVNRMCKARPACVAAGQGFESVSFNDCYGAVLLLAYGFGFAFIIFIIELLQSLAVKRFRPLETFEVVEEY